MHNVNKYKYSQYEDHFKNETTSARQGSAFDMKKDSVKTCLKDTKEILLNDDKEQS